jgi:iron complex outermembrane receptor protein
MRVKTPVFNVEAGVFFEPFSPALNLIWFRACSELNMARSQQIIFIPFDGGRRYFMKHFISIFSSLSLFVLLPFLSFAQEKEVTLDKVVVTATRDTEEIRKVPANVTVITREKIEESNAQTVTDVMKDEVGIVVRDYFGTGKTANVDIRGIGETGFLNTLVLVDGRRVNEIDLSGVDWTQIPLDQIERIEIVRGSGSVLYGDNAAGGVINIITKRPEKPFSASGEIVAGSYHYNKEGSSVSGKWGPLSAILSASHNATNGYRHNGFLRAEDVGGKLVYDLNDQVSFNLSGNFHQDSTGLPFGLKKELYDLNRRATTNPDDRAKTDDGYAVLGMKAKLWDLGRIETDISYRHRELADFFFISPFQDKRNSNTLGITPKYILDKPLLNFPNKLTVGLDFYRSKLSVFSNSSFSGPNRSEVTKKSTGAYIMDEFSILNNLILSLGYRQEWVTFDIAQDVPNSKDVFRNSEPAWNAGLSYLFGKNSSAFLSFKRSFRYPVSDELIQYIINPGTFEVIGIRVNPDMKSQIGYHYEAGIRHAFTDQIEANMTLYWIDFHDEIFFNPFTYANENYPRTRRAGIETGARVKLLAWLSVWGNYSYIRPTVRKGSFSGNDIPGVPWHKGSLGTEVDFGKGLHLSTLANIVGSRRFLSDWANQAGRQSGYYTVDMKLSYFWRGLNVFIGVNNLLNRKYAEFAVVDSAGTPFYYSSPDRNFIGGISYTF